jgi:hypothetical protein
MDLRSGRILGGAPEPPIEEIPDEESQQTLEGLRNWGTA